MVTAGAEAIVEGLIDQLAPGGTLVAPVGGGATQALVRIRKQIDGSLDIKEMEPVLFVPLLPGVVDR
jgi:protein-L-isoaspartate(D-aspartate) O-methyltransferase